MLESNQRDGQGYHQEKSDACLETVQDFYPVVTFVLYFGDSRWKSSLNLKDHLKIPEGLDDYVYDYKANLFEIAFLSDEQVSCFQSDFRYVVEYFVATRKKKEGLEPTFTISVEHLKHVEEFIELMNAITNSDHFSRLPKLIKERGDDAVLTILFDEAEERGIEKGIEKGRKEGERIGERRGERRGERKGRRIGEREGRRIGEREGRKVGEIIGTIRIYDSEMHLPPEEIVQRIMTRFSLKKEEAEQYVENTRAAKEIEKTRKVAARPRD